MLTNQDGRNDKKGWHGRQGRKKWPTEQQTLFKVWLLGPHTRQAKHSPNHYVSKELVKVGEKPDSSVGAEVSMIHPSVGSKTGEELHDDRSECTNAESVIRLDNECITDDVPTQAEIDKNITIDHIPLPKQFPNDLDKQAFPEITFKICGTNGEMYNRVSCLESSKTSITLFAMSVFWHTTGKFLKGLH